MDESTVGVVANVVVEAPRQYLPVHEFVDGAAVDRVYYAAPRGFGVVKVRHLEEGIEVYKGGRWRRHRFVLEAASKLLTAAPAAVAPEVLEGGIRAWSEAVGVASGLTTLATARGRYGRGRVWWW